MACDYLSLANAGVRRLKPYQAGKPIEELKRELGLKHIVKLASNENPLGTSYRVQDACAQVLQDLALYPDSNAYDLKQMLAKKYGVNTDCITLGNGSNNLLDLIGQTFLTPRHSVIFSEYAFVVYPLVTQIADAKPIEVKAKHWGHDLNAMLEAIDDSTRLIFLANPNNPTGTYFSQQLIEQFLSNVPENILVVLDEAYGEYCDNIKDYPDSLALLATFPNLIVSRTFSKAYGLAGLRVGYTFSHPDVADALNRVRAPFNVNAMGLTAACAALNDHDFLRDSKEVNARGMSQLTQAFEKMGIEYIPSVANFMTIKVGDAEAVYQALLHKGVIVRPLSVYNMPEHLRVSIGLEEENDFFIEQLKRIL